MGLMTCHILPGAHAREYIVRSSSRAFNIIDLAVFLTACTLFYKLKVRISEKAHYVYILITALVRFLFLFNTIISDMVIYKEKIS
jgi:hypothetical protein